MCDERERMLEYLYDECSQAERRSAEDHLAACETCRDELHSLRAVRNELAAWDAPVRASVWTPFVPPRVAPWWRQVPAWAMAAAATLVFATGAVGGFAMHTALAAPVQVAQVTPAPAAVDPAAIEQTVLDRVRTAMTSSAGAPAVRPTSIVPASTRLSDEALLAKMRQLIADSDQRRNQQWATTLTGLLNEQNAQYRNSIERVQTRVDGLDNVLQQAINRGFAGDRNSKKEK